MILCRAFYILENSVTFALISPVKITIQCSETLVKLEGKNFNNVSEDCIVILTGLTKAKVTEFSNI